MLNAITGAITGTPTMAGASPFTVGATDGGMNPGTRTGGMGGVVAGGAVQLALTATFTDGTMQPVPSGVMWTSSDPTKATVDASGRVTSLSPGSVTITAVFMGQATTFTLVITAPGTSGLMPNPAPVGRPAAPAAPTQAPAPLPPTRAAAPGPVAPAGGSPVATPQPAPPRR